MGRRYQELYTYIREDMQASANVVRTISSYKSMHYAGVQEKHEYPKPTSDVYGKKWALALWTDKT